MAGLAREKSRPLSAKCACSSEVDQFTVDIQFAACEEETAHKAGARMSEASKGMSLRSLSNEGNDTVAISSSPGPRLAVFTVVSVV